LATIKRNLLYNFLLSVSQVLFPLLSIPYVARVLDPEGVGRVAFIDSFSYYFVVMAELGITVYGIREVVKLRDEPARLKKLVKELMGLRVLSSTIMMVVYAIVVWLVWDRIADLQLLGFSIIFLLINFLACDWYFMGMERFGFIAFRSISVRVLGLIALFVLVKTTDDFAIYYAIMVFSAVAIGVWNYGVMIREQGSGFLFTGLSVHLKKLWVIYLIGLLYSIPLMLDNVLLRLASVATAVGFYTFPARLVRISSNLLTDSFLVFLPRVTYHDHRHEAEAVQERLLQNSRLVVLLSVPMGVGIFLLSDQLAAAYLGDKFLAVAANLRWLAVFPFLKGMALFLSNPVLMARHREKAYLRNLAISSSCYIPMAVLLSEHYADAGACIALVAAELLLLLLNLSSVRRLFPDLRVFDWRLFAEALLLSALFVLIILGAKQITLHAVSLLLITVPACIVVYFLLFIYVLKNPFARQLWSGVNGLLKRSSR
jgi:O-antigen/teichoic acid export membrane protein